MNNNNEFESLTKTTLSDLIVTNTKLFSQLTELTAEISSKMSDDQANRFGQFLMENMNYYSHRMGSHYLTLLQVTSIQLNKLVDSFESDLDKAKVQELACSIDKALAQVKIVNTKVNE